MVKHWIEAFRFRTLPLALSCIGMGSILAAYYGAFNWIICLLALLTTLFLQILSNLANDYGDSIHGADSSDRKGPQRTVQQGVISSAAMKRAIYLFSFFAFTSGISLLYVAIDFGTTKFYTFLGMGVASIIAAIAYTNGKRPYGYLGLGDLFVLIFFGLVGVGGTYWLFTDDFQFEVFLPALSCGFLATGVLNVNNIRDIESDQAAGKRSIPVRLGRSKAKLYHLSLILAAWLCILYYCISIYSGVQQFLVLISLPLFVLHLFRLGKANSPEQVDPLLKQLALSTLFFVLAFGFGVLL